MRALPFLKQWTISHIQPPFEMQSYTVHQQFHHHCHFHNFPLNQAFQDSPWLVLGSSLLPLMAIIQEQALQKYAQGSFLYTSLTSSVCCDPNPRTPEAGFDLTQHVVQSIGVPLHHPNKTSEYDQVGFVFLLQRDAKERFFECHTLVCPKNPKQLSNRALKGTGQKSHSSLVCFPFQ